MLYLHEVILLLEDNLISGLTQQKAAIQVMKNLIQKQSLDPQAVNFLNLIQSQKPLAEIKLVLSQ